jgi:hypothetical protein
MGLVYDPKRLSGVTTARPRVARLLHLPAVMACLLQPLDRDHQHVPMSGSEGRG